MATETTRPALTMDHLRATSAERGKSVLLLVCTEPAWSHLIDDIIATGVTLGTSFNGFTALGLAVYNGILEVANALVAAGVDPTLLGERRRNIIHNAICYEKSRLPDERRRNIIHNAVCYDNSARHSEYEVVKCAIDLYPGGINDIDEHGSSPLQMAIDAQASRKVVGLLLSRGSSTRTLASMENSEQILEILYLVPLLLAYGYRFLVDDDDDEPPYYRAYNFDLVAMMAGTEQCRSVARMILGLIRQGGRVQGNGRDALRLVAKEVWLSRMDERWIPGPLPRRDSVEGNGRNASRLVAMGTASRLDEGRKISRFK